MNQVTIASGIDGCRVWTDEQKRALVAAACEPGSQLAKIARRADLRPSQLYRWRRDLAKTGLEFAAVMVSPDRKKVAGGAAVVVVELGGAVLRIAGDAPSTLAAVVVHPLAAHPKRSRNR